MIKKLTGYAIGKAEALDRLKEFSGDAEITKIAYGVYKTNIFFTTQEDNQGWREGKLRFDKDGWQLFWKDKTLMPE